MHHASLPTSTSDSTSHHRSQLGHDAKRYTILTFALLFSWTAIDQTVAQEKTQRPNVLVMMVDDLGFSDLGCYGSEIETPNLDRLAADGVRFSQFYNTAKCHSSRVSLLTGQYCMAAGDTSLSHGLTSAEILSANGYFTAMTGKWHLKQQPTDFGFTRYFGHLSGACNYFTGDQSFRLNGKPWKVPAEGFYTTVANVDYAINFLDEARTQDQPWYLYVAFNAPHAPLHALPDDYAKYQGKYTEGWDEVRDARVAKQKSLGIIPKQTTASPRPDHIPNWENLQPWRRTYESKRMSTLAAMIDRVDREVGRLINNLKSNGELDRTFILFVSDNGACPYDRKAPDLNTNPTNGDESFGDSTGWAWARNSPFRYYKQNQFEGGIATPAIAHWPAGLRLPAGSIIEEPSHLIDVLPTIADLTDSSIPETHPQRELRPISGQSLTPLLRGESFKRSAPLHFLFSTDRGLRESQWKIVSFRQQPWELYDLSTDRTEQNNLADTHPELTQSMVKKWTDMTKNMLHAPSRSYAKVQDTEQPHQHPEWTRFERDTPDGPTSNPRRKAVNGSGIRARKNTKMILNGGLIELQFTGDDPGIAMDLRSASLPNGPYQLRFRARQDHSQKGEVYFTTDRQTTLPNGKRISFELTGDNQWQNISLPINTQQTIYQIRIDLSDNEGSALIDQLELTDNQGNNLYSWPRTVK